MSLQLFKQLLQFHINDKNKNALVDVDLERIEWVYSNLLNEQKDEQYQNALELIANNAVARASKANYLLAQLYVNNAQTYQPFGDTTQRYSKVKALQIIEAALARFKQPDEGTCNLVNLRSQILKKENFSFIFFVIFGFIFCVVIIIASLIVDILVIA